MKPAALDEVVGLMEIANDSATAYLNVETGQTCLFTDDGLEEGLEGELDPEEVEESDSWVVLPGQFEINEWSIMDRFSRGQPESLAEELGDAIRGRGAFRLFRRVVQQHGVEEAWCAFRQQELEALAKSFLALHRIPYV